MEQNSQRIDLMERAQDALVEAGFPNVKLRPLAKDEQGLSLRRDPSTVIRTYMNGVQEVQFVIAVYARFEDEAEAIEAADLASRTLRFANLASKNGSYTVTGATEYSGVTEAETHTGPLSTYVVGVRVDITTNP